MKDSANGYSGLSIALHWLGAIAVIAVFLLGATADDQPTEDQRREFIGLHISLAMSVYLLLVARILWRVFNTRPEQPRQAGVFMFLAYWVPVVLLICMAINLISGPFLVWTQGYPINVFGLFGIPSPTGEIKVLHDVFEVTHSISAQVFFVAVILHILGVFKHLVINRDGTLMRMIKPSRD